MRSAAYLYDAEILERIYTFRQVDVSTVKLIVLSFVTAWKRVTNVSSVESTELVTKVTSLIFEPVAQKLMLSLSIK